MQNTQNTQKVNLEKFGNVVGVMSYGFTVQVWCQSLDGGPTDSRIFTVDFPNFVIADRFTGWFKVWTSNGANPTMHISEVLMRIEHLNGKFH